MADQNEIKSPFMTMGETYDTVTQPRKGTRIGGVIRDVSNDLIVSEESMSIAGMAKVGFIPLFGVNASGNDPLNTASKSMYADIQTALRYKSNLGFDRNDVINYILFVDSLQMMSDVLDRALRALNYSDRTTSWDAEMLVAALGFDAEDLRTNRPDVIQTTATWATAMRGWVLPTPFNVHKLHHYMCTNTFRDSTSDKAQWYVFVPEFVYSWSVYDTENRLEPIRTGLMERTLCKWADFKRMMSAMLNSINGSASFERLNSAFLSTYGDGDSYAIAAYGDEIYKEEFQVAMKYDPAMLTSLCNAILLGEQPGTFVLDGLPAVVVEDGGVVTEFNATALHSQRDVDGVTEFTDNRNFDKVMINSLTDDISGVEFVNYMRWRPTFSRRFIAGGDNTLAHYEYVIDSCSTEVLTNITVFGKELRFAFTETPGRTRSLRVGPTTFLGGGVPITYDDHGDISYEYMDARYVRYPVLIALLKSFAWLPIFYIRCAAQVTDYAKLNVAPLTDWNYFASVSQEDVKGAHQAYIIMAFAKGSKGEAPAASAEGDAEKKRSRGNRDGK